MAVLFAFASSALAQGISDQGISNKGIPDDAELARVGDERITVGEFRARYALGVFPYKDQERLAPVIRVQFLYSLIAERLLMAEARRLGFDAEDRFRRNRRLAEEMFMRDRLFRDSVRGGVTVTDEEIRARYVEDQQRIQFDFLFSRDEEEVRNLHRLLRGGIPFDTLLAEQQRDRIAEDGMDDAQPREEVMDESFRARIDVMMPGGVSEPLRGQDGWYLVRKMDYGNPLRSEADLQKRWKRIESQLRGEKEAVETVAFVRRLWQGRTARFEEEPYRAIGETLLRHYRAQSAADTSEILQPLSNVFDSLRVVWESRLAEPFLRIENGPEPRTEFMLPVGDALDRLQAADLRLAAEELSAAPELYRIRTRELADRFLITSVAYTLGIDRHDDVRRDVAMWEANGLAEMVPDLLWEQFISSDDSVWNYYITRPDLFGPPVEVRIIEVLTRDEARMRDVIEMFRGGDDLRVLAQRYSERPGAAERGGELGYFPVSEYGAIGRAAFGLQIADAAGPISTPEGFAFIQLVDKRYPGLPLRGWDVLRDSVAAVSRPGLMRAKTDELLRKLAARGGIAVDTELLGRVPVTSMQMFSIRALGFGGRIPAVPGVAPLHEAVMEGMGMRGDVAP